MQVTVSNLIGPELTDILAAITAIASLVLLFRIWRPKECMPADARRRRRVPLHPLQRLGDLSGLVALCAVGGLCLVLGHPGFQGGAAQNQPLH